MPIGINRESVQERGTLEGEVKVRDRVVRSFVEGNDVFICLPTGYGKSLCFAITTPSL